MEYQFPKRAAAAVRNKKKNADARADEIRRLAARGLSKPEIAKLLCIHTTTVQKALAKRRPQWAG